MVFFPLSSDVTNLNVFGWDSTCPIYGGTGSAGSHSDGNVSILQSLQDAGYKTNETLSNMYTEYCAERPTISMSAQDWSLPEPNMKHYTDDIMNEAKDFSDTAMVVLGRPGGEGADLSYQHERCYQRHITIRDLQPPMHLQTGVT